MIDRDTRRGGWTTAGWLTIGLAFVLLVVATATRYDELTRAAVAFPLVVALVTLAVVPRRPRSFDLRGIALTGLGLKLAMTVVRYHVIFGSYDGTADALAYHEHGGRLAHAYRSFDFAAPAEQRVPGTGFLRMLTGGVYAVLGVDIGTGFLVFCVVAFAGAVLLYLAFELAVPDGDHRRYALLVFLWPSLLFWPASIGKEAWVMLAIGATAYGVACVLAHRRGGFVLAAMGFVGVTLIRPHITLILFVAFFVAYLLRRGSASAAASPLAKAVGVVVLLLASGVVIRAAEDFFHLDDLNAESVSEALETTQVQSSQGGSAFTAVDPLTPVGLPAAIVTILVRPFPFEADSAQMLFTSIEGLGLLTLVALSWRRIAQVPGRLRTRPYVAFSLAYTAMFILAFSSIGNFGILARQRVQVLPFLFVLLALPLAMPGERADRRGGASGRQRISPARPVKEYRNLRVGPGAAPARR